MADDIGVLQARVVADIEGFRADMNRAARQLESNTARMNRSLASVSRSTGLLSSSFSLVTRTLGALGVAFSVRSMVGFVSDTIRTNAELKNLSERLNVSVESLSELQYVAKLSDVDFKTMTSSLQVMTRTIGEAVRGSAQARQTFRQLGVDFRAISAIPVDQQFETIAEALKRVEDESARVSLAQKAMGRAGVELLQVTNQGATGIRALRQELRDMGGVVTTEMAEQFDAADDAIARMKTSTNALAREMSSQLAPAIMSAADAIRRYFYPSIQETFTERLEEARQNVADLTTEMEKLRSRTGDSVPPWWKERHEQALRDAQSAQSALEAAARPSTLPSPQGEAAAVPGLVAPAGGLRLPSISPLAIGRDTTGVYDTLREAEAELTNFIKLQHEQRLASAQEKAFAERDMLLEIQEAQLVNRGEQGALLTEVLQQRLEERIAVEDQITAAVEDHERVRAEAARRAADDNVAAARYAAEQEIFFRQLVVSSTVGLLQALGAKHRGAAIAALAIQKALAIKEILIHSQVAQMRALRELGPIAGAKAAAAIAIKAKISAGLVAAAGLVEAAQLSSGGVEATLGTSANPIHTTGASSDAAATIAANRRQKVVEFHVHGNVYGAGGIRKMLEDAREVIDGADVILIGPNSLQASKLGAEA